MSAYTILIVVVAIAVLIVLFFALSAISLWFQSLVSGAKVGLLNIIFMRFRKVPPKLVVESKIMAIQRIRKKRL